MGLAKTGAGRKAVRVALLLSLVLTAPASAMTVDPTLVGAPSGTSVVDTTVDGVDAVRDGICATASGQCTLRAAVQEANAGTGPTTIQLRAGTYVLTLTGAETDPDDSVGDLDVGSLTLVGSGQAQTIVHSGAGVTGIDRVLQTLPGSTVSLTDLTLENGNVAGDGGNVYADGSALTLTRVTVQSGKAARGAGIYATGGSVTLDTSTVSSNAANVRGGGILNEGSALTIRDSTIDGNDSGQTNGGIGNTSGSAVITRSTLSNNWALETNGAIGSSAALEMTNVTVAGNRTEGQQGAGGVGVMGFTGGNPTLTNVTVANNTATSRTAGMNYDESIGTAQPTLTNVLFAGNVIDGVGVDNCAGSLSSGGEYRYRGAASGGGNFGDTSSTDCFNAPTASDYEQGSADLGPLAQNLGPTKTMALGAFSAAVDAGRDAGCPATDQQGQVRKLGGDGNGTAHCDPGAWETPVMGSADLVVAATDSPDPVDSRSPVTYSVTVTNDGPDTSRSVRLTDPLPVGVTFDSASAGCTYDSGTVSCALGDIPATPGSNTKQVTIIARPQQPGSITNIFSVWSATSDPSSGNDARAIDTTVRTVSDLGLTMSDSPDPVDNGGLLTYSLTATNDGHDTATSVQVLDVLPPGVTYVSASSDCQQSAGTVTCSLGSVASGESKSVEITIRPTQPGTLTNDAQVSTSAHDPNDTNDSASATTAVNRVADLSLTLADAPDPVQNGQDLTYTLTAANAGGDTATSTQIVQTLPAGATFVSASNGCSGAGQTVTCALGDIPAAGTQSVQVKVRPTQTGTLTASATASTTSSDPATANNSANAITTVDPTADLSVALTASPEPVVDKDTVTYTLTATNHGPDPAQNATLSHTLDPGTTYVSASDGCSFSGGTVTCAIGTIPTTAGSNAKSVTVTVRPEQPGTVEATSSVHSLTHDPNPANDTASVETTVRPRADLSVSQVESADPAATFGTVTYTVTVTNNGPDTATDVTLSSLLGGQSQQQDQRPEGCVARYEFDYWGAECDLGDIPPTPGSNTRTVTFTAKTFDPGTATHTATASTSAADPVLANNESVETTAVKQPADLELEQSAPTGAVARGSEIEFTVVVRNQGPQTAEGVRLTDVLPSGTEFVSATVDNGATCNEATGTLSCELGDLGQFTGYGPQLEVTITLRPTVAGTLHHDPKVSASATLDPDETNNADPVDVTVAPRVDLSLDGMTDVPSVRRGGQVTHTFTVTNNGPDTSTGGSFTTSVSWDPPASLGCTKDGGTVSCPLGTIPATPGQNTKTFSITRTVPQSAETFVTTTAAICCVVDTDVSNNEAAASTPVQREADLAITAYALNPRVTRGELLDLSWSVQQNGPEAVENAKVTAILPSGVEFVAADASSDSTGCTQASGVVTCDIDTLPPGSNGMGGNVTVRPTQPGKVDIRFDVTSDGWDKVGANDSAVVEATAFPRADVSVTGAPDRTQIERGHRLTYTITATNNGPDDAPNAEVGVGVELGTELVSGPAGCARAVYQFTCPLGTLTATGASKSKTVKLVVRPMQVGALRQVFWVEGDYGIGTNTYFTPADTTVIQDTTAPETTIEGAAGAPPPFSFSADELDAKFECRVDGAAFAACTSPADPGIIAAGAHTFEVVAIDQAGNRDGSPASRTWTVAGAQGSQPPGAGGDPGRQQPLRAALSFASSPKSVFALANGTFTFKFRARAGAKGTAAFETSKPVAARVGTAAKKVVKLGRVKFTVAANGTARVKCKLSKANRKLLKKLKKVTVKVTVTSGTEKKKTTFTLRTPKPTKRH